MVVTFLPYLIAFGQPGTDWRFTGFLFGASDGNSYIAKMLTGMEGAWLFRTPYTAYPQPGLFLFFPYILLGKLAGPPATHEQLVALYHLYRLAAGFLVIFATYDFAAVFIPPVHGRKMATILAVLGGGFGWLSILGLNSLFTWGLPLESYSPEAFGFLSIYGLPHLAVARALLLWGLRDFLTSPAWFTRPKGWLRTGSLWIAIGIFQPIIQAVGLFVIAFFLVITGAVQVIRGRRRQETQWQPWKTYLLSAIAVGFCAMPIVAYTFFSFKQNPILQVWESQSIIGSPSPLDYLLGYGVVLPLALMGARPLMKENPWKGWLLTGWLVFAPIAAYGPITSQRRFLDGFWVVLSVLTVVWVIKLKAPQRRLAYGWLLLAFPTTLFLLTGGFYYALHPGKPLFRPADEVKAFEFLAAAAQPGDVVLASDDSANPLPAWAPVRLLNGHGPESIRGDLLRPRIACFYTAGCPEAERASLLDEFEVDFVFWGPGEQELGDWDPHLSPKLQPIFSSGDYFVFKYHPDR